MKSIHNSTLANYKTAMTVTTIIAQSEITCGNYKASNGSNWRFAKPSLVRLKDETETKRFMLLAGHKFWIQWPVKDGRSPFWLGRIVELTPPLWLEHHQFDIHIRSIRFPR